MPSSGAPEFSGNIRRPASAGGPEEGEQSFSGPLWARPPKYKLCDAPDDVIQVFSFLLRQTAGLLYPVSLPVPFFCRKIPKKASLRVIWGFRDAPGPLLYLLNEAAGAYLGMNYGFRDAPSPLLYLLNEAVGAYLGMNYSFRDALDPFSTC